MPGNPSGLEPIFWGLVGYYKILMKPSFYGMKLVKNIIHVKLEFWN